jgi:hypothetical protein
MSKYLEILIIVAVLVVILASLKIAHGAGSLAELQSEAKEDTSYRDELIYYIHSHNMTNDMVLKGYYLTDDMLLKKDYIVNVNTLSMEEFEVIVKKHIQECESGSYDNIAKIFNLTKNEISTNYGDC